MWKDKTLDYSGALYIWIAIKVFRIIAEQHELEYVRAKGTRRKMFFFVA